MDLSDFFITKEQAIDFATKLSAMIDTMYTTTFDLEKALTQHFGMQKKDAFLKLLRDNNVTNTSHAPVQDFLKKIQEIVANLSVVSLTIAFEPTEETLKSFSQWFVATLNKQVLFEIHRDNKLIAGARITYNGKFKDYSLEQLFDATVQKMALPQQTMPPAATASVHQNSENMEIGR